jgi:RNA polymerase sigma factor (sigma-70 family)
VDKEELMQNSKPKKSLASNEEDIDTVNKILAGDNSAFRILQKKYKQIIASLIRKMVRDEDDIDDLTQETFIKAYNALDTYRSDFPFSAWIYRIASNNCIDFLRKKRFQMVSLSTPIDPSDEESTFEIKDTSYQPDLNYMSLERRKALKNAIESLPENYRLIVQMRHEEELDYKDISDKLNLPLGTVKAHLFRARKIMLTSLQKDIGLFYEN